MAAWLLATSGAVGGSKIQVAIEVPHGPVVETLIERGFKVHAINPKQMDRFRDRFTLAGAKDDSRDAQVMASAFAHRCTPFPAACSGRSSSYRVARVVAHRRGPRRGAQPVDQPHARATLALLSCAARVRKRSRGGVAARSVRDCFDALQSHAHP